MATECFTRVPVDVCENIEDVAEETFILFSQDLPHNDLGIIDNKTDVIEVEVNGREYQITQSPGLLKSSRATGTTGAMVWKVTPRVAQWLASPENVLWNRGVLNSNNTMLELGSGVAGIIGMALSPHVTLYILTDQPYVLKLLRANIDRNTKHSEKQMKPDARRRLDSKDGFQNLHVLPLDWELDSTENLQDFLPVGDNVDVLLICDCVYNSFLIEPLAKTCIDICKLSATRATVVLIAQQLRTEDIFEEWLTRFLRDFKIWRIKDEFLPTDLRSNSGYVVHLASLRGNGLSI